MKAQISISKKIVKMVPTGTGTWATTHNLSEFASLLHGFDEIEFSGELKPAKFLKYESILVDNGFRYGKIIYKSNSGFSEPNADVFNFRIIYSKP